MRTGKSLTELAAEIQRRSESKRDLIAPVAKLKMATDQVGGAPVPVLAIDGREALPVNALAHQQIAAYVDIPRAYYERLRENDPALLAQNVNRWFRDNANERRMLRTLDNNVRAFLSDKYRPLENEDLAEAVLPVLGQMDLMILSCEITDLRMYIKAVDRSIEKNVPTGRKMGDDSHTFFDTVSPAVTFGNSEVGAGSMYVQTGIFTKVCTNLATVETNIRRHHVGGRAELSEEVYALLSDKTKRLTDQALWGQVTDVVRGAFNEARFEALTNKLAGATQDRIETDVVQVVERLGKRNAFGEATRKSVLQHLIEGADLTRYGLHAAVTRASAEVENYDDATDLERLGGRIIEMPSSEWKELAIAA